LRRPGPPCDEPAMAMTDPSDFPHENLDRRNRHIFQVCSKCGKIGELEEDFTKDAMGTVCDPCFDAVRFEPEPRPVV
jgi:hypothetical protein